MAERCVWDLMCLLLSEQVPSRVQVMGSPFKLWCWVQSTAICGRNEGWGRWQLRTLQRQWVEFGGRDVGMATPPYLETYKSSCLWMKGELWFPLEERCWNRSESYRHQRGWIFGQSRRLWASSSLSQELLESGAKKKSWSFGHDTSDQAALSLPF